MLDFAKSLSRSSRQFREVLEKELQQILKGKFEVVEGITIDEMAKLLDTLSGIDVWHINNLRGIRGVALRIQTGDKNWHTFTVRNKRKSGAKTEYEKRKYAIQNGYLYPYLSIQAYISKNDKLLSFAIAKTEDIMSMIEQGFYKNKKTGKEQIGQAEFFVIDWYQMKEKGYKIVIREETTSH